MNEPKNNFRKVLIINPRFQYRMMIHALTLGAFIVGVLYGANYYLFYNLAQTGIQLGLPATHPYFQFLEQQNLLMNWIFLITAGVVLSVILLWGAVISHRIAGPVYRICKHLQTMAETKKVSEVSFRKNDYFPELADSLNSYLKKSGSSSWPKND